MKPSQWAFRHGRGLRNRHGKLWQSTARLWCRRRAVTMLEVVVAIAIIAILLALLFMALQKSRATASRVSCTSNLRQLGIAVNNYISNYGYIPGIGPSGGNWTRQLLPYFDQANVESAIEEWRGQQRKFQDLIFVSTYICPTDPYADRDRGYFPSYRMCEGSYRQKCRCCDGVHYGCDNSDAFWVRLRPRDVTDGMSQTAAMSEKLVFVGTEADGFTKYASDHPELWIRMIRSTAIPYLQPDEYDRFANECEDRALPMGPVWRHDGGGLLDLSGPDYNHVLPPNRNSCYNGDGNSSLSAQLAAITATSVHDGGVNVLMADGAVRFASNMIDRTVWRAVGTRNRGEVEANEF